MNKQTSAILLILGLIIPILHSCNNGSDPEPDFREPFVGTYTGTRTHIYTYTFFWPPEPDTTLEEGVSYTVSAIGKRGITFDPLTMIDNLIISPTGDFDSTAWNIDFGRHTEGWISNDTLYLHHWSENGTGDRNDYIFQGVKSN